MIYRFLKNDHPPIQKNHLNLGGKNEKEEIQVTSRYLEKNEKPWIPIMGEFHYCRVPRKEWARELAKLKAGGISVVATYVIWIYHEEEEGTFDFSGNKDIGEFVKLCGELGLQVFLRIGPWVHGEVRNGGLPDWILGKGIPIRSRNEAFLHYVRIFYRKIYQEVKEYLFDKNGCVVGIQLDNEMPNDADYLLALKEVAREIGFRLPLYTVTGWNAAFGAEIPEREVLPVFGGYPEAAWTPHTKPLPPAVHYFFLEDRNDSGIGEDLLASQKPKEGEYCLNYGLYPFSTCELGGGMEPTWLRRPVITGDDVASLAMVKLGCGNNLPGYYMYHGGTNGIGNASTLQESKESGYPNDYLIRSYDFQAPIGEYGQLRDHYRKLKLQHYFIQDMQEILAPMDAWFQEISPSGKEDRRTLRYSLRTDGQSGFVFVNNHQHLDDLVEHREVQFEVWKKRRAVPGKFVSEKSEIAEKTETMVFPDQGMTVQKGKYFILPFGLDLSGIRLRYATAQFLCHERDTWFFFLPQKGSAEFVFERDLLFGEEPMVQELTGGKRFTVPSGGSSVLVRDGEKEIRIVTLSQEKAEHLYRMDETLYWSSGDLYEEGDCQVCCQGGNPDLLVAKWNGKRFVEQHYIQPEKNAVIDWSDLGSVTMKKDAIPNKYLREHFLGNQLEKTLHGYRFSLNRSFTENLEDAYLSILYQGDVVQIYDRNGNLLADDFYKGTPWEVSVNALLKEKEDAEFYLIISDLRGDIYLEQGQKGSGVLEKIVYRPVYRCVFCERHL